MFATPSLAKLRALSPAERRLLLQALVLLPVASAGLGLAGMRRTRAWLAGLAREDSLQGLDAAAVARVVRIAARRGPVRAKCLSAALTLEALLRRHGHRGELKLGVRKRCGRLEAHAWIEHEGTPLMEPAGVRLRFAPLEPPAGRSA
jgi:hypothetical protein